MKDPFLSAVRGPARKIEDEVRDDPPQTGETPETMDLREPNKRVPKRFEDTEPGRCASCKHFNPNAKPGWERERRGECRLPVRSNVLGREPKKDERVIVEYVIGLPSRAQPRVFTAFDHVCAQYEASE